MRDYLDLCKHWVYELYSNHGVRVNELHKVLVHYREPWVESVVNNLQTSRVVYLVTNDFNSATRLRSAIVRWTKKDEPGPWPLEQIPRRPGFLIPPPPIAPPHLLSRLRVTEPVPNSGLSSMPMTRPPNHPNQKVLHYAGPSSLMPNSMTSRGMPMLFNQTSVSPSLFSSDCPNIYQTRNIPVRSCYTMAATQPIFCYQCRISTAIRADVAYTQRKSFISSRERRSRRRRLHGRRRWSRIGRKHLSTM